MRGQGPKHCSSWRPWLVKACCSMYERLRKEEGNIDKWFNRTRWGRENCCSGLSGVQTVSKNWRWFEKGQDKRSFMLERYWFTDHAHEVYSWRWFTLNCKLTLTPLGTEETHPFSAGRRNMGQNVWNCWYQCLLSNQRCTTYLLDGSLGRTW